MSAITPLDFAILGLLNHAPLTGYAVRKLFATTPMAHYSDSPGSIYPALERLRRNGLVAAAVEGRKTVRPRRVYRLSESGVGALREWVATPVTRDELVSGRGTVMLRFVVSEQVLGRAASMRFLESFAAVLADYVEELEAYYEAASAAMTLCARLALRGGIESHRAQLRWVNDALHELENAMSGEKSA